MKKLLFAVTIILMFPLYIIIALCMYLAILFQVDNAPVKKLIRDIKTDTIRIWGQL